MQFHIGQIIEQKFQESGIKLSVFAERINTGERNVYTIFKRKDINVGMLKAISDVLDFDFLSYYSKENKLPVVSTKDPSFTINLEIEVPKKSLDKLPKFLSQMGDIGETFGFKLL